MKNLLLLFSLFFISFSTYSQNPDCTIYATPFCPYAEGAFNLNVFMGKIVGVDTNGIDLEIIDILRGAETRPVVRIWDGTDRDCNGTISMAAADLGDLNDSIVIVMPLITTIENTWDVIGDYRRPNWWGSTVSLKIENGIAKGMINGYTGAFPQHFFLWHVGYEAFKNSWDTHGDCTDFIVATKELESTTIVTQYNNPIYSDLTLNFTNNNSPREVLLYSSQGQLLKSFKSNETQFTIDCSNFTNGFYLIKIQEEDQRIETLKVIKI